MLFLSFKCYVFSNEKPKTDYRLKMSNITGASAPKEFFYSLIVLTRDRKYFKAVMKPIFTIVAIKKLSWIWISNGDNNKI